MDQETGLLLVDDEPNIITALNRIFRKDGYPIFSASNGTEGLAILKNENIGVIISDQRMPGMTGSEFLSMAKEIKPDTIRIILSGYTELNSITDSINRGAIYKFFTKPWDDDLLRTQVHEAFRHYQLQDENIKLTRKLSEANNELSLMNMELEKRVEERTSEMLANLDVLTVKQEILDALPIGVLGFAHNGMLVTVNEIGMTLFDNNAIVGSFFDEFLSAEFKSFVSSNDQKIEMLLNGKSFTVLKMDLGKSSRGCGFILVLVPHITNL